MPPENRITSKNLLLGAIPQEDFANVEEIGPLRGERDGNVIDALEIRKLQAMRVHDLVGSS